MFIYLAHTRAYQLGLNVSEIMETFLNISKDLCELLQVFTRVFTTENTVQKQIS